MTIFNSIICIPMHFITFTLIKIYYFAPIASALRNLKPDVRGWLDGAKVLGKLPVPGRHSNLEYSRARAYCACSRCGWGLFGHFSLIYHSTFLSPSLWDTARYRLNYCLKGPLSPKQPTNKPDASQSEVTFYNDVRFATVYHRRSPVRPCIIFISALECCFSGVSLQGRTSTITMLNDRSPSG